MTNWQTLEETCRSCTKCALHTTRTNCVFGTGNRSADLLFVGEAPGEQEDLSGTPFVGRAGKLLDQYLFAVDIPREDVYIANIVTCRPPQNRDPLPEEEVADKLDQCFRSQGANRYVVFDLLVTHGNGQVQVQDLSLPNNNKLWYI